MPNETRAFTSFMDFALGFNSVSCDIRGQAVTRTPAAPVPGADGQTVIFHVQSVTSISDIKKSLGVDVETKATFLEGGGSAAFNFSESTNFHSFSSYLLVTSFVTNATTHMLNEQLITGAPTTLLGAGQLDTFAEEFGDFYIKGIETGGQFFSLIEVVTTDATDQTSVSASLSVDAFVGLGVAGLTSHFSSTSLSSLKNHSLQISALQSGGQAGSATQFVDADAMLNAATIFATTVFQNPVAYQVELQDYQSLNLPPPPNAADIQNAKDMLADCGTRRADWIQFRNDIEFILQNPLQFETPPVNLSTLDNQGAANLNLITNAASACLNDLKSCPFVSVPVPDRTQLPARKPATVKLSATVPDFTKVPPSKFEQDGQSGELINAQELAQQLGITLVVISSNPDVPLDHGTLVVNQNPQPNQPVPLNSQVTVIVETDRSSAA